MDYRIVLAGEEKTRENWRKFLPKVRTNDRVLLINDDPALEQAPLLFARLKSYNPEKPDEFIANEAAYLFPPKFSSMMIRPDIREPNVPEKKNGIEFKIDRILNEEDALNALDAEESFWRQGINHYKYLIKPTSYRVE